MDKCEYCDPESPKAFNDYAIIYEGAIDKKWRLEAGTDMGETIMIEIFYCPMCGRKLEGENNG